MNMEFRVIGHGQGLLLGVQYWEKENEDDWNELSIYLVIITLNWRWL